MNFKVKKRKLVAVFIYMVITIIFLFFLSNLPDNINDIGVFCIIHILSLYIVMVIWEEKLITYSTIFIIFCMVFFYGQTVVQLLDAKVYEGINIYAINDPNIICKALLFAAKSMHFIILGMLVFPKERHTFRRKYRRTQNNGLVFKIGLILFLIGIIPKLIIDLNRIRLYSIYHYNITKINILGGYFSTISNFAEYGLILMMISKYKSRKFSKTILILSIAYQLIPILCGVRARAIIYIVMALFFYAKSFNTINIKNVFLCMIGGYLCIILLNIVSQVRQTGITFEVILEAFKLGSENSPIFTALEEFGNTLGSVCYIVTCDIKNVNMNFGILNPMVRCLNIFPNIAGFLDDFQNIFYVNTNFSTSLPFYNSLGGSFLCELYFDAGSYGCIFGFLIGLIVEWVEQVVTMGIEKNDFTEIMYILPLFANCLWWIRDNFIVISRELVWNACLIYLISYVIGKKGNLNNESSKNYSCTSS